MSRPLRIEYSGALYHVMSRGNARKPIVLDDGDRIERCEWLRRTVETYGWMLHAFVLMTNHDHLFVETPQPNLAKGMQFLNGSYTGYFNRRHGRVGHLLQGRYKAQLIEREGHYLELSRYLHLNPCRAAIVERPEAYRWSSYPGYHRADRTVSWVTYNRVLAEFGDDTHTARAAYRRFVYAGIDEDLPSPLESAAEGLLVGSRAFTEKVRRIISGCEPDREKPQMTRLRVRPDIGLIWDTVTELLLPEEISRESAMRVRSARRVVTAHLARRIYGYSSHEIAQRLGYASSSGVAEATRRFDQRRTWLLPVSERIRTALEYEI